MVDEQVLPSLENGDLIDQIWTLTWTSVDIYIPHLVCAIYSVALVSSTSANFGISVICRGVIESTQYALEL